MIWTSLVGEEELVELAEGEDTLVEDVVEEVA